MIIVCDIKVSRRAYKLRQELFSLGYPCACVPISEIGMYVVPTSLIITFSDVFEDVRRTPYDKIYVIAIGTDFVNSGLNAERVQTKDELIAAINRKICEIYKINKSSLFSFGVRCHPELFISNNFIQIRCRSVRLTKTEFMIFKYLYSFYGGQDKIPAKNICKYCFAKADSETGMVESRIDNDVAVNVNSINRKFKNVVHGTMIKSKREQGYYIANL